MTYWILDITKQMKAVDYNDRLAVSRDLNTRIGTHGLRHQSLNEAKAAAEYISKNPLVVQITVTRHQEVAEGVWRNGKKYKE